MGMFDTLTVVNAGKTFQNNFKHCGEGFQTKSFDCKGDNYVIFNDQLYIDYSGEESSIIHPAKPVQFSGEISLYNGFNDSQFEYAVHYVIELNNGVVSKLIDSDIRVTKDKRDIGDVIFSQMSAGNAVVKITGLSDVAYSHFHQDLERNLEAIRTIVGDPKASIAFPQIDNRSVFGMKTTHTRQVFSCVQSLEDLIKSSPSVGDAINANIAARLDYYAGSSTIVLDEAHSFFQPNGTK